MAVKNNKNGLIELFRFLCSLWVAYFHGFSPIHAPEFNGVNISVDFFFMVSGMFFLHSIEKYREKPFLEGARFIFWGRTKRFIVPLIIAALSVLYCNVVFELEFNGFNWPFSFLWFFAAQFVFLCLFYLALKKTKRRSTFNIILLIVICLSMSFFKLEIKALDIFARGPAMLAVGMLISQIPHIEFKRPNEEKGRKISILLNAVGFTVSAVAFIYLGYLPGFAIWKLHLLCCVICPALIYFAVQLPVYSKFLNFLGEFSVYIYLAQCPILLHHFHVSRDTRDQFPWLCVCAVLLFVINRVVNTLDAKKKAKALEA